MKNSYPNTVQEWLENLYSNLKKEGFKVLKAENGEEGISKAKEYRPDLILCNAPDDRHIDHPRGAKLVVDSCFLSGLKKVETIEDGVVQEPWRPINIYHYIQWKKGDSFHFRWQDMPHGTCNFGHHMRPVLFITGVITPKFQSYLDAKEKVLVEV